MTDIDAAWDDPDRAVQPEDDNPESLAGAEVEFDPDANADAEGVELHDSHAVPAGEADTVREA